VTSACANLALRASRLFRGLAGLGIDVEEDDVAARGEMVSAVARPRPERRRDNESFAGNLHKRKSIT
jgi:hypothetical protein